MVAERITEERVTRWLGFGDSGYEDFAERHPEFVCPRCKVLFALDRNRAICAVAHEVSCPAS